MDDVYNTIMHNDGLIAVFSITLILYAIGFSVEFYQFIRKVKKWNVQRSSKRKHLLDEDMEFEEKRAISRDVKEKPNTKDDIKEMKQELLVIKRLLQQISNSKK